MYILDAKSKIPLHIQLYQAIKEDIVSNYLVGDKLPSIRKVATLYNLSKNTVESAYSQLYAEGYVESRAKSGYYVSELFFDSFRTKSAPSSSDTPQPKTYTYDFFPAQLHKEDFPLKTWKRLYNRVITTETDFGSYPQGQGELVLREAIAKYLKNSRGVVCGVENIIITHGFIDSMELIAKLAKARYTHFAQEIPGYHIAHKVFKSYGYKMSPIKVDEQGLCVEELKKSQAQIVYITPSHQYPTGVTMPVANRLKLIAHMQSIGGLIIEDDYDSELAYYNRPIPSLQGLDKGENVAYLGTFAKALSPSIRVGYMVLPSWLMKLYNQSYDMHFARVSLTTQLTLATFIQEGHWDRHIRRIRILNKKKHQTMKDAIEKYLGESCKIVAQGAGLAILIVPTSSHFDWEKLKRVAEEHSIRIYLSKDVSGGEFQAVRMGFGGFRLEEIDKAIEAFSLCWQKCLTPTPKLEKIIIGREAKKPLHYVNKATVIQGKGIEGDRYFYQEGTFNKPQLSQTVREISLIDYETLATCNQRIEAELDFLDLRRNLVLKNVDLKELIGKEFSIGTAKFRGLRVAPPCRYLSRLLGVDMMTGLKYIGGLRALVVESGEILVGDEVKYIYKG